jgi:hypothetical protein
MLVWSQKIYTFKLILIVAHVNEQCQADKNTF